MRVLNRASNKTLIMAICIIAMLCITMFSTLAYLTDRDSVVNTFTVGKIDITVDETDVDRDGNKVPDQNGQPAPRVKENLYHLIPGKEYLKDPMMTVKAGSEESYVRMIMAVNNADKVQALINADDKNGSKGEVVDYKDLFAGWDDSKWTYKGYEVVDNTIYFEFRYFETVDGFKDGKAEDEALTPLFNKIKVPGYATAEQLANLGELKIIVHGHAIQSATFKTADEAWAAFENQYPDATTGGN